MHNKSSEVDFVLGRKGGKPSSMTLDPPQSSLASLQHHVSERKLSQQGTDNYNISSSLKELSRPPSNNQKDFVDQYGLFIPQVKIERQYPRGPITRKNI